MGLLSDFFFINEAAVLLTKKLYVGEVIRDPITVYIPLGMSKHMEINNAYVLEQSSWKKQNKKHLE
jgi:hypothetical protein